MKRICLGQVIGVVTLASAMLAGCGGGGGGDAATVSTTAPASDTTTSTPTSDPVVVPTAAVDGIYNGTTSNTDQAITVLILADNSYYIMYSKPSDPASFDGVAFGSGTLSNGNYFSGSFKDISLTGGVSTGTLVGGYISKQSFIGTLGYYNSTDSKSFSSVYDPSYATAPSLTTVAGVYTGTLAAGPLTAGSPVPSETLLLKITDTGVMSGDLTCSCTLEKATMSLNGTAYAVSLTFSDGDGTHPLHGQVFAGSAYFDAPNKRLVVAGTLLDAAKTPAMFVGTKP